MENETNKKIEKTMIHGGFLFAVISGMFGIQYESLLAAISSWFLFSINIIHCYSMGYIKVEDKN